VLALPHPQGAASHPGSGTYLLAIGVLAGMVTIMFAPPWLVALVVTGDIVVLGWSFGILHYADTGNGRWVWVALIFLFIGLYLGVIRGLRHLSDYEFGARLRNIRSIGRRF